MKNNIYKVDDHLSLPTHTHTHTGKPHSNPLFVHIHKMGLVGRFKCYKRELESGADCARIMVLDGRRHIYNIHSE